MTTQQLITELRRWALHPDATIRVEIESPDGRIDFVGISHIQQNEDTGDLAIVLEDRYP